ncbi:MAG: SDR family oxidoreductase [Burkholderiales bacterium]
MARYEEMLEQLKAGPRTWLVTGAAGFIGSNLVEALLGLEQRVVGLDNFTTGTRDNLAQTRAAVGEGRWANFRIIKGDIRSLDDCRRACRSVNFVLHHAALGSVPQSIADPIATGETNVTGFLNMLVAAHGAGVSRFVYAGSSAVYGDHAGPVKTEAQIGRPLSPYAVSKVVNELYAENFARCYGFNSIGLRYFNVFGPRQDPDGPYAAVIPRWISEMMRNEPVYINGDGGTTRDFCYVENVVQANLLAATTDDAEAVNQVYNVGLDASISLNELFETIRSLLEPSYPHLRGLRPAYREFRHGDVRLSQADISKAGRLLGYRPAWPVRQGLARTIDWYLARLAPSRPRGGTSLQPALSGH